MTIEGAGAKGLRPNRPETARITDQKDGADAAERPTRRSAGPDRIEISDQGRALAAEAQASGGELSPERLTELRERLDNGYYDDPATALRLAERLIDRDVV
jgi:hypothetical protein